MRPPIRPPPLNSRRRGSRVLAAKRYSQRDTEKSLSDVLCVSVSLCATFQTSIPAGDTVPTRTARKTPGKPGVFHGSLASLRRFFFFCRGRGRLLRTIEQLDVGHRRGVALAEAHLQEP